MNTKRLAALTAATAITSLSLAGAAVGPAAAKVTTTPPPQAAPTPIYTENFENFPTAPDTAVALTSYTGAAPLNETYTANPAWLPAGATCNGIVLSANANVTAGDGCPDYAQLKALAGALGTFEGVTDNHVVSAYTAGNPGANLVQFQTVNPIPLPTANRFITFGVNAAEENCYTNHAHLEFYLVDVSNGNNLIPTFTTPIDPCGSNHSGTAPITGSFAGNQAVLFAGSQLGVEMVNGQGTGVGNDFAFDNIQILDATPQLSKDFAMPAVAGQPDVLTFTITNTTENAAKNGWSFTDALPAGMTVAANPAGSTTCSNAPTATAITAAAGGSSIAVTGNLASGQASCTVSVAVTAPGGNYTNGSGNITSLTGLLAPPNTSITFNTAPTVVDDTVQVPANSPTTIDVLANDSAAPGATLNASTVHLLDSDGNPQTSITTTAGTYTVNSDGTITFAPAANFTGTAPPVRYEVSDSNGTTGSADLTVTTLAPPTVDNLSATTTSGNPVILSPLDTDTANGGATLNPASVVLIDPNGNHVSTLTTPDGSYTVNPDGTITFTPVAGFTGTTPPVPYEVTDSTGTTGAATLTVTVAPAAGTPLAAPTAAAAALATLGLLGFGAYRRRARRAS